MNIESTISKQKIRGSGYKKGYNVFVYNNEHTPYEVVVLALFSSGLATDMLKASTLTKQIDKAGYIYFPFATNKLAALSTEWTLRGFGLQSETLFEEGEEK